MLPPQRAKQQPASQLARLEKREEVEQNSNRTIDLPRFSVNDNKGNFDIYRSTVISDWVKDESDGVYMLEVLA